MKQLVNNRCAAPEIPYKADADRFNEWADSQTYWRDHKQELRDMLDESIAKMDRSAGRGPAAH